MSDRRNHVVVITGAGSGLGRALALRYARAGWRVAVADIALDRAQAVVGELQALGNEAEAFVVDVGDEASMNALRDAVLARFGNVDHVINNAGVASAGDTIETTLDDWRWMLDINLLGVVRGCRAFVPGLVAQGHGHVINTASFAALAGAPGLASYSVAKAGVVALSESLRAEMALRRTGVGVSVVCPAFFQTNLLQNFRGPEAARTMAGKLMRKSADNADSVAARIFDGAMAGRFLILPTRDEPMRWRLKRWLPEFYFRKLIAAVSAQGRA
jgi:NADP-dependent 3-hydroxy acid dehydrogenase YdfG